MNLNKSPLDNKNIIITRSYDSISEVKDLFQKRGANIYNLPSLVISYPDEIAPLDDALSRMYSFNWIIFSSSNGIKYVDKRLKEKGSNLLINTKNIKIAVVGNKTSQYLKSLGIKSDYVPPDFIAESLIDNFPVPLPELRIFIPRVQSGGRSIISQAFSNAGAQVVEVAAYESKCPNEIPKETLEAIQNKIIDAIVFSSGKTVVNSALLLKKYFGNEFIPLLNNAKLITIGPQTSLSCQRIFGRVDKEATKYSFEGVLDAAIKIFS